MAKNYLLVYSEQLAINIELMCQGLKASSNTLFSLLFIEYHNIISGGVNG